MKKYHMSVNVNMCIWVDAENDDEAREIAESEILDYNEHISNVLDAEIIEVKE